MCVCADMNTFPSSFPVMLKLRPISTFSGHLFMNCHSDDVETAHPSSWVGGSYSHLLFPNIPGYGLGLAGEVLGARAEWCSVTENPSAGGGGAASDLREMFLKTDNYMGGRYFAEIVKGVFADMEKDVFTFAENRISIYGKQASEWSKLANWYGRPDPHSNPPLPCSSNHHSGNYWMQLHFGGFCIALLDPKHSLQVKKKIPPFSCDVEFSHFFCVIPPVLFVLHVFLSALSYCG